MKKCSNKAGKGSQFEREFAKLLSRWWTEGERDDVFWRSSNSGGRATIRQASGISTFMQAGDIAATDPIGIPLLEVITFELKRGYTSTTLSDVIDKPNGRKPAKWEQFVTQASNSADCNASYAWALITRRDRRVPLIWYPQKLDIKLQKLGVPPAPIMYLHEGERVAGCRLEDWLANVSRDDIMDIRWELDT